MKRNWKAILVGALVLCVSLAGCVEDEASVVMIGNVIGEGELEPIDQTDDGEILYRASCEFPPEFEDANIRTNGFIDLAELQTQGQPLVQGAADHQSTPDRYVYRAVIENRLFDSRTVGSGGSGGDGGGFQNLELDKNDILITSATVRFPIAENTFGDELEEFTDGGDEMEVERLVSMVTLSGGGLSSLGVSLIQEEREREVFEDFLNGLGVTDTPLQFVAEIQLHGETLAGNPVESNRISYPVDICLDCGGGTDPLCIPD